MTDEILDFDAVRGEKKSKTVKIAGKNFIAKSQPSVGAIYDVWRSSQSADEADVAPDELIRPMRAFLDDIFGAEPADEIFHLLDQDDLPRLVSVLMDAYDAEGKARGSNRASRRPGGRSKPTSDANTTSISAKSASARNGSRAVTSPA